jgi:predicted RNA polymerase sigma factor
VRIDAVVEDLLRELAPQDAIDRATSLLGDTLPNGRIGPYQLQAAIAAIHTEAPSAGATDWPQVLALYTLLQRLQPNPMVALDRAVAVAMVHGANHALDLLDQLAVDDQIGPRAPNA